MKSRALTPELIHERRRFMNDLTEAGAMSTQIQLALQGVRGGLADGEEAKRQLLAVQLRLDDLRLLLCDLQRAGRELLGGAYESIVRDGNAANRIH